MKHDSVYIKHISDSIALVLEYTKGVAYEEFLENQQLKDAVVRNLEIIGEAVKMVSLDLRNEYPSVPWQEIARTRDQAYSSLF